MNIGDKVISKQGNEYTITKLLGQGGQGFVFLIESPRLGPKVLKWYFEEQATEAQYEAIMAAIRIGSPDEERVGAFIWPQDIVEGKVGFGYIMNLIDTKRFIEYGDMISNPSNVPDIRTRCIISYNLVNAFQKLHLRGYCYRDISEGNFLFDVQTGDVVICDNDNVGVEGMSNSQVLGTLEYMAPEVIKGEAKPGTSTDLYSLAILLFKFWMWHHPYHGMLEYSVKSWDLVAKKWLYGDTPIFIFDKNNDTNRLPDIAEYNSIGKMWKILPKQLQDAFETSFTLGIRDKSARLREFDWISVFKELLDSMIYCPKDRAENFYQEGGPNTCWNCGAEIPKPPFLKICGVGGMRKLALTSNTKLYGSHIDEFGTLYDSLAVVGYMNRSPLDNHVWGLYNNTNEDWKYAFPDGHSVIVNVGKSAPLLNGGKIIFNPSMDPGKQVIGTMGVG